jgi:hypothetical protein
MVNNNLYMPKKSFLYGYQTIPNVFLLERNLCEPERDRREWYKNRPMFVSIQGLRQRISY